MARNEKGEDWARYMKEINRLTPLVTNHMDGGSSVPIINSRQAARAAGFKNIADAKEGMEEQRRRTDAVEAHKAHLVDKWFEKELSARFPTWFLKVAGKHQWMLTALGIRFGWWDHSHREGDMPKPMPATLVYLKWFRWTLAMQRMVWDDPTPPKRRIITLP